MTTVLSDAGSRSPTQDHVHETGSLRSSFMNVIESKDLERDAGGEPVAALPRPASGESPGRGKIGMSSIGNAVPPWRGGLAAARRHTVLVRFLRGGALVVCLIAAGIVLSAALRAPSRQVAEDLSAEKVSFDGTRITLETPKISGFQLDRRPYSITARRGVQDLSRQHIIELFDIDAGIGTADNKVMQVLASRAQYDSRNELISLTGDVRITSTSSYDLTMQTARVDIKNGTLISDSAVTLRLDGVTIGGERMEFDDRHHMITFDGGVSSSIAQRSDRDASPPVPSTITTR
jgi:lipopolysaccharide export system protein LptC